MRIRRVLLAVVAALAPLTAHAADPIVVGEYGSMTGSQATFGKSTDAGIQLAVAQVNAKGGVNGRPIKLVVLDDAGKQSEAHSAVTRLIEQDHAVALLGEVASSLSITNAKVTQIGDMISRVCFIDSFQGMIDAQFAVDQLKLTKAAVLYNKSQAYSTGLRTDFRRAFGKMGGTVAVEQTYSDGDNDYSAQLAAIKAADPQFVFMPGYYTDVVNIARQARQAGITVPFIGSDGWSSDELKNAGTALDGCFFSDHYAKEDTRPIVKAFQAQYAAANGGQIPDSMAATGYDAANLLFDAMTRAKSLSGDDLAAAINTTVGFHGVTGDITIDAQRNAKKGLVMQQVHGGDYSFYSRVEPK
jgi:branched-chain amino acid transport system substrate-binding protein